MVVVLIHNPFDADSRNILAEARKRYPKLEVYDFQVFRGLKHVQGAPIIWLMADGADPLRDEPLWSSGLPANLDAVDEAIRRLTTTGQVTP